MDVDAGLLTAHSEKEGEAPTYKHGFGFHPLLVFLDRPDVSGGEALAGILRPGNAGSNAAADHLTVLDLALAQLPEHARPTPGVPDGPQVLIRADSAGVTHAFLAGCRERAGRYSVGLRRDRGRCRAPAGGIAERSPRRTHEDDLVAVGQVEPEGGGGELCGAGRRHLSADSPGPVRRLRRPNDGRYERVRDGRAHLHPGNQPSGGSCRRWSCR